MADSDLSRIVNLIMENPALIEEIKGLANGGENSGGEGDVAPKKDGEAEDGVGEVRQYSEAMTRESPRARRRELLCALKPYISEKRSQAIDSMLSIVEILDVMRSK